MKSNLECSVEIVKLPFFAILGALNFVDLVDFSLQKSAKIQEIQNSEHINLLKWQTLRLYIRQF